ncbi:MAG: N-acetylglucosamine-6-phosphate deacetylase [Clostridia bacterium]|nr:N-acetylglucosamine-6-phosphate deacetylase [Clostridia bacterium]
MIIKNARINGKRADISAENGKITYIGEIKENGFDAGGLYLYPGLIDIHVHGIKGRDAMDGDLSDMAYGLAKRGTTCFYPTTMTAPFEKIKRACEAKTDVYGARIPGFHLEGPYISEKYKGAQKAEDIRTPDLYEFKKLKNVKIVTLAPETPGALEFIENCGCTVSLGHTDADYETAVKAARAGASCVTHAFNAHRGFHHREPGVLGAAITENMYVTAICDGLHLHKAAVLALYRTFGADRMILISDGMRATNLSDGKYELGGQTVTVKEGVARTADGALAGGTHTLLECVKTAVSMGIPKEDALKMATETPARLMGLDAGEIRKGAPADFILCDKDLNLKKVIINGELLREEQK